VLIVHASDSGCRSDCNAGNRCCIRLCLSRQFADRSGAVRASPGFAEFVTYLRRNGIRVCVVSLAPINEITSWLRATIDPAAIAGIYGIESGPKSLTTKLAIAQLGVAPTSVICIGDTPADLAAAAQFGCRFIRMHSAVGDRCEWPVPAVPTVAALTDVPAILKSEFGFELR
jgi:phosphoglycolate phosphatase-like HAD superfamily hydrolase